MRLLEYKNDREFSLIDFGVEIPDSYAILSHTWGADNEEVTFRDLMDGTGKSKAGYDKIRFCGEQARRDGLKYFWVDTCCIDKSNHSELSEAINSMYRWYQNAAKCYVYLSDVSTNDQNQVDPSLQSWQSAFRDSRWFTRGWTLQELIAPRSVEFFCSNGKRLGDKKSLERQLHNITGIAALALQGTTPLMFSVEERMSWAKHRQTQREEDRAYSLLGIFDIQMPLIYGEGAEKAFNRLHRELQQELYELSRKRHLEEVAPVSNATFNTAKRLKDSLNHSIEATIQQSLIEQLYFTRIDEHLTSLKAAQATTCRWFFTTPEYISWHDVAQHADHGGFLWIKGNPGTGKSTLMKFLFESSKDNAKSDRSQITLSFFFLARGTDEEQSTTGLYRSLLHQLFKNGVDLKDSLEWMTSDGAESVERNGWHEEALKQTFTHSIQKLGNRSLMIFVDALDECDQNQVGGMVGFFEELCDCAREAQVHIQICFSSRHYPSIVIQRGVEVTLENEIGHTDDIKHYIKSKLRLGKSKQAESLRSEIFEKSSGIFLWVVLVLDILNSEYSNSVISIKKIRGRLQEIPQKLTELFEVILTRDRENLEQLQICLKWILFAIRPLKPQELYFAIQLSLDKECSTYWDQEDMELDRIKDFVRSSSKGLAEVTRNKASQVQFIHESVRDFLLGKYGDQWTGLSSNFVGYSHETLRDCCLAQLNASINQDITIPNPLPKASEAAQLRETISLKFPFLEYSVLNVFHHANRAQRNAMDQSDFLDNFPLEKWIMHNNTIEKHGIRRYTPSVSLLYILAEKNSADLIRIHPQRTSCFEVESERYGLPLFAALATKSHEAVQTLLQVQAAEVQPHDPLLHRLCTQYYASRNNPINISRNFLFSQKKGVCFSVAELGEKLILAIICALGKFDVKSKDVSGRTPLSWAAENGGEAAVKLLLKEGAELESRDKDGQTPLLYAVIKGQTAVIELLLEKGAKLESTDSSSQTPFSHAIMEGQIAVVELLLEKGAKLESIDNFGRTPLSHAIMEGQIAVVELLLEKGAKLESTDNSGQTPLSRAAENGHTAAVELLLEKGAKLESIDILGCTPLHRASELGHADVVELLLEKDAKLESINNSGQTPLHRASDWGSVKIVKLLLEKGAILEHKDNTGQTPLHLASEWGYVHVVELLLEEGADAAAIDGDGRTPLQLASKYNRTEMIELLG
ncbi:Vegetative incompatibility protein HET-E-1 [Lachnellula subtilissima]|uniref:Vegetative incompatibility protein HET-E-1 n=1 Tax=Lachnellula subtilissima TaxID=602034 RepID=A0A8H8RK53_9HELO|nr:Vegetative incompatibility protein HET-E-1 [Lachnellula subtilissima]